MWLLREHTGPLRADLRREYGIDLDAVLDERSIRPTVLLDLVDGLSLQAAVWRSIDPDVIWGLDPMLLALLVDEVRVLRYEFEKVNFKGTPKKPEPLPRPGVTRHEDVEKTVIGSGEGFDTIAEFDAWYASVRASQVSDPGPPVEPTS